MTEPAWQPDPSGRHQLRWFDGTAFTDQVADDGVRSTDGGPAVPAPMPLPVEVTKKPSRLPVILVVLGALLVVVALVTLLNRGDGDGTGTFEREVAEGGESRHSVSIPGGSVLIVQVRPDDDLDAVVDIDVDGGELVDAYEGSPLADEGLLLHRDVGFDGEPEQLFLAAPFDVDADVVVTGFEDTEGTYEVELDVVDLDLDDDPSIDDLLDAVASSSDVPRAIRDELETLLGSS